MGWASEKFETIDLGDMRLNKRAALLAERLVDSPSASIPTACQGWKETQPAYRLISNDAVNAAAIAEPHIAAPCNAWQRRLFCCAIKTPVHWKSTARTSTVSVHCSTKPSAVCFYILPMSSHPIESPWAPSTRRVGRHSHTLLEGGKLWASVTAEKPIGQIRFILAARRGVKSLPVHQQLLIKRLSLPNGKKGDEKGTLEVTCLVAQKIDPPKGAKPVQWRLLTNRVINTLAEAGELID